MLICAVQSFILDINIWDVKCDKALNFTKSGHIYYEDFVHLSSKLSSVIYIIYIL